MEPKAEAEALLKGQAEAEAMLKGQAEMWQHMFGFAASMALKCAVDLRIADIMHSHGGPITLSQLASKIDSATSPDTDYLARIMRVLVRKKIFTLHQPSDGGEALYGLTRASRWIVRDSEVNLVPMITWRNNPDHMAPLRYLAECVKDGGIAFKKAHGMDLWAFTSLNPEFNDVFNEAMACTAKIVMRAFLDEYKDGFANTGTLVDVGGGTGGVVAEIVKANPHVKGINFDLPHVIATAPERQGVTHVSGNMFESIPSADAVLMKWIMHDWNDEDCIKILKNCRAAIPEKTGKVVIVDSVVKPYDEDDLFAETALMVDITMMGHTNGGKERTENEWKKILKLGGFPRYKITKIAATPSIIEACPN